MRRILSALLVGVMAVFLSAQAQTISTHEIVKVLSAQGDVTSSDLQAALGQWQLELFNLPHKTDFFQAQYVVDADENGRFEVGVDPVYTIMGIRAWLLRKRPSSATSPCPLSRSVFTSWLILKSRSTAKPKA